ncbi:hypothetical protein KA005_55010 [bacterium]|nr:hypothetical protein [bacterium]
MKTKEIIALIGVSGFITMVLIISEGIEDIVLAIITFLIVIIMCWLSWQK